MNIQTDLIDKIPFINTFYYVIEILDKIWHYPIVFSDRQPISMSNLVTAIILFFIVLRFIKSISKIVNEKIALLFPLNKNLSEKNVAKAIERILYYVLLGFSTFVILQIANIPITAFAFIGGALAIGLGFGSQNIINNLISGLIIMIEQPIRIGDVIEYEKFLGVVTNIGARCTHVLTYDNYEIIVPNSTLLQNTIVNLMLNNNGIIRANIEIAISVDNDPEQVTNIISSVINNIEGIVKDKATEVALYQIEGQEMRYRVFFWCLVNGSISKGQITHNALTNIHAKFKASSIKYPEYYDVLMHKS